MNPNFAKRKQKHYNKHRNIEKVLLNDNEKIKELEAQAKKMLKNQEVMDKKREEKNKKIIQEKLASKEKELKQKGIDDDKAKEMLEEHQKELDSLMVEMDRERARQRDNLGPKLQDKLKQKEMLQKQREEQLEL